MAPYFSVNAVIDEGDGENDSSAQSSSCILSRSIISFAFAVALRQGYVAKFPSLLLLMHCNSRSAELLLYKRGKGANAVPYSGPGQPTSLPYPLGEPPSVCSLSFSSFASLSVRFVKISSMTPNSSASSTLRYLSRSIISLTSSSVYRS